MTQRIFDIENEKDMQNLWDIVPDGVYKITQGAYSNINTYWVGERYSFDSTLIAINWHDKTEITRPVDYESMIGCVGWFDGCGDEIRLGILTKVAQNDEDGYCFLKNNNIWCKNFRPAKKSELKFWGEDK